MVKKRIVNDQLLMINDIHLRLTIDH